MPDTSRLPRLALALPLSAFAVLAGCGDPAPTTAPDAGVATAPDAGLVDEIAWHVEADYPTPVVFASASVLPVGDRRYLYVVGGQAGTYGAPTDPVPDVRRAEILPDHTLGAWEDAGRLSTGMRPIPLAGHHAIQLHFDDGSEGVAVAGGGTGASDLPLVLTCPADPSSGALSGWGRFDPMLTEGAWFATFEPFDPHMLALIGGTLAGTPTARVVVAPVLNGAMSATFIDGPPLPSPRFGHASAMIAGEVYVIGGANDDGVLNEVVRTTRDATMHVEGWLDAGSTGSGLVFAGAAVAESSLYVLGGLVGGVDDGTATARVLTSTVRADGSLGVLRPVDGGALPAPVAAPIVATDAGHVYVVGGYGADDQATARVLSSRLP
jgi:hypothetical protein